MYNYITSIIEKIKSIIDDIKSTDNLDNKKEYIFLLSDILQDWGDNIRLTGNPFISEIRSKENDYSNLYKLSEEINIILKFLRYRVRYLDKDFNLLESQIKNGSISSLFVLECFRNPYEIEYFRARYAEFYLWSLSSKSDLRKERVKYFSKKRDDRDRGIGRKSSELNKLDVRSCALLSDIVILNKSNGYKSMKRFFEKLTRYFSLIRSPGCIQPNDNELYMHLAYSHSLKSTCISRKVGAIILGPNGYILGAGWNDVGEGQIGCGLRTKDDYLNIQSIPKSTSDDQNKFLEKISSSQKEYFCYKDLMSKVEVDKKIENITKKTKECSSNCLTKIKEELGIKRLEYCRALHAEENALLQLAKVGGMPVKGGTIYTTTYPCELCAKKLYQTGIKTIYYTEPYPESISDEVFLEDGSSYIARRPFEGVKSYSFYRLFKPIFDKKDVMNALDS